MDRLKQSRLASWLLLGILLCLFRTSDATVYYVNNVLGTDSTNCANSMSTSPGNPWRSINAAINNCGGPGHTVRVMNAGQNYTDLVSNNESNVNWPVGSGWGAGQFFTLEGDPSGPRPILKPTSPGGKTGFSIHHVNGNGQSPQYIAISHFEVDGNGVPNDPRAVGNVLFYFTAPHLKITDNKFHAANNQIISGGAWDEPPIVHPTVDFTFQNNEVYDAYLLYDLGAWPQPGCPHDCGNPAGCPCGTGSYCLYISPKDSLIADNRIHDCAAYGIHFYHGGGQSAITGNTITRNTFYRTSLNDSERGTSSAAIIDYGTNETISNNIFYSINNPASTGCEAVITLNNDSQNVYNNTIADSPNCVGVFLKSTAGSIVRGNIFANLNTPTSAIGGSTGTISNNFTGAPNFLGASSGNYHIASGSNARSACPNFFSAGVTVDIDGEARPSSDNFDCGADQVVAGTPPVTISQLEFGVQPSTALANATLVPSVTVRVETSNGSLVTTATDTITLALVSTQIPQGSLAFIAADSTNPGWPGTRAIDGDTSTAWHTDFTGTITGHPHNIVLTFPSTTVNGLVYTPRLGPDISGQIAGYNIYVSTDCATWGPPIKTGTFGSQAGGKRYGVSIPPTVGNCLKLESTSNVNGDAYASAAEINILQQSGVSLTGALTQPASGGIATFSLAVPTAGVNYVLKATSGSLTPQMSMPFTITTPESPPPAGAAQLFRVVPGR